MRLRRNLSLGFGGALVAILILSGIFGPLIAHHDPLSIDFRIALAKPTGGHPLGCDSLGRDMLARLMYGARLSLAVSILWSRSLYRRQHDRWIGGARQRRVDSIAMRSVAIVLAFPASFSRSRSPQSSVPVSPIWLSR